MVWEKNYLKQTNKQLHQTVKINTSITNDLKWKYSQRMLKIGYFFTGLQNHANDKKYHNRRPS